MNHWTSALQVINSLLRVDNLVGEAPPPFERVVPEPPVWVIELSSYRGVAWQKWCEQAATLLREQAELLQKVQSLGGRLTLFVNAVGKEVDVRLESDFMGLLARAGVALECSLDEE